MARSKDPNRYPPELWQLAEKISRLSQGIPEEGIPLEFETKGKMVHWRQEFYAFRNALEEHAHPLYTALRPVVLRQGNNDRTCVISYSSDTDVAKATRKALGILEELAQAQGVNAELDTPQTSPEPPQTDPDADLRALFGMRPWEESVAETLAKSEHEAPSENEPFEAREPGEPPRSRPYMVKIPGKDETPDE